MNWLIWKEYRQNRVILLVAAALLILPHAVALCLAWYDAGPPLHGMPCLAFNVLVATLYSLVICQLVMALLGGNAIAGERIDRSAEFLFYLPLSRVRILAAKIAVAVATTAVIWIPNLVVLLAASSAIPEPDRAHVYRQFWGFFGIATTGLVFFTVAWLLSSLMESPTFSTCGGLITPCLIVLALALVHWLLVSNESDWRSWTRLYSPICLILAAGSFTAGTWYYLRRVEP